MEFESILELKARVMPALLKRSDDLKILGYDVTPDDIWNYFKMNKWCRTENLSLNEIVNDILKYTPVRK